MGRIAQFSVLLVGFIFVVSANSTAALPALELRAGRVYTSLVSDLRSADRDWGRDARWCVVQLDGANTAARRAAIERLGIHLGDYLPHHAYLARLTDANVEALRAAPFVRWVGRYRPEWRVDPSLAAEARQASASAHTVQVIVTLFAHQDPAVATGALKQRDVQILNVVSTSTRTWLDARVRADNVRTLASLDCVEFIEPVPVGELRNHENRWVMQSNMEDVTPIWDAGLHGEDHVAGLIDDPFDIDHCAFADDVEPGPGHRKLIAYRAEPGSSFHGTHVAGTLAGDHGTYNSYDQDDGLAFASRISFSDVNAIFSEPSTFYARLLDAHQDGARVHNNSWGSVAATYITWSEQADRFVRDHENDLVVFAASNSGIIRAPENGKNVLAVAATHHPPMQDDHCFGGEGPTLDGRRKPDVCAPGCLTRSAWAGRDCDWTENSGTSMAAPVATAAGVLVRQYFAEGFHPSGARRASDGFAPTAALLKACLINSAADMAEVDGYPSDLEGWGRILLDDVLYFAGDQRRLYLQDVRNAGGLDTGASASHAVEVTGTSEDLRITLVWTDVAAAAAASYIPVNNLDLSVTAPGGQVYLGNVFNTETGYSTTGGSADELNNVEQVHLASPAVGTYRIRVLGTGVNQDLQGYALAVSGKLAVQAETSVVAARSCADHDGVGTLCLDLPGANGVEPRIAGPDRIEFDLDTAPDPDSLIPGAIEITCSEAGPYDGEVTLAALGAAGLAVDLDPALPAGDCCRVELSGVTDGAGQPISGGVTVRTVPGDTNRDGLVTTLDASLIKRHIGRKAVQADRIYDLDGTGRVAPADVAAVVPRFGSTAPACP